jgi:lipopolysaccharide biosynthesis glycosyltransferase
LGLAGEAPYFNGGVLLADLAAWRRDRLAERMLACLREHHQHVRWWDQYALNVVLAGQWREIDPRWNQGAHVYAFPGWQESPFNRATFESLLHDPWIVHFTSHQKPWHYYNTHPFRAEFLATLERTAWRGWRPAPPDRHRWRSWWRHHWAPMRHLMRIWRSRLRTLAGPAQPATQRVKMREAAAG